MVQRKSTKMTEEQKQKIYTKERAAKISATLKSKGIRPPNSIPTQFKKGIKMPLSIIQKRSITNTGKKRPKQSLLMKGAKCNFWKGGITPMNLQIRHSYEMKIWREAVFKRDNYTCQICGKKSHKGLEKTVILNADHIKPFAYFPDFRFNVSNGRTLCGECHKKTDTYAGGAVRLNNLLQWAP